MSALGYKVHGYIAAMENAEACTHEEWMTIAPSGQEIVWASEQTARWVGKKRGYRLVRRITSVSQWVEVT
jgi:hypothetical protein